MGWVKSGRRASGGCQKMGPKVEMDHPKGQGCHFWLTWAMGVSWFTWFNQLGNPIDLPQKGQLSQALAFDLQAMKLTPFPSALDLSRLLFMGPFWWETTSWGTYSGQCAQEVRKGLTLVLKSNFAPGAACSEGSRLVRLVQRFSSQGLSQPGSGSEGLVGEGFGERCAAGLLALRALDKPSGICPRIRVGLPQVWGEPASGKRWAGVGWCQIPN